MSNHRRAQLGLAVCMVCLSALVPRGQGMARDVVLWPGASATLVGNWQRVADSTAAGGTRVWNPDAALPKAAAVAAPADYFEMTFNAEAGVPYRLWMRGRAERNHWSNDSLSVQFSGSVNSAGTPQFRIGTTSATTYIVEDCTGCDLAAWGWQDNGYGTGVLGPLIYFAATGQQTIRVQRREDGISIDQVVISGAQWLNTSPGATKNDTTILPATGDGGGTPTLPSGWQSQDIGAVGQPGSASESNGTFTVSGAGADVWGSADALHYAYRTLAGDGSIVARVASIQGAEAWTKVGVMIRQTTAAGSPHAFMLVSTSRGLAFQRRTANGGASTSTGATGTAPRWVRLVRAGNVITASVSSDGTAWTVVGQDTFSMPQTVLAGLAVSSHNQMALATATFDRVTVAAAPAASTPWANGRLQVAPNGHFLRHQGTNRHFFYLADTPWGLFTRINRADADFYLSDTKQKGFNAVQAVALWRKSTSRNVYGDRPMFLDPATNKYDPTRILTTPGDDPNDATAYDYWDHVDYVIGRAEHHGLYVALLPTWGEYVSGTTSGATNMSSNTFTEATARSYGRFLGQRYGSRPNIIWMLGGDRSAVYTNGDFRAIWRALAEGVAEGVTGQVLRWDQPNAAWDQLLMTYHPRRVDDPGSSLWFHGDAWLDFNGIETEYDEGVDKVRIDWNKLPPKPTALLEGRYEDEPANDRTIGDVFRQRFQLYQNVFAGSLGYGYGHQAIWDFLTPTDGKTWRMALNDPGRVSMQRISQLFAGFTDAELLNRMPDQTLLDGSLGTSASENLLIALRDVDRRWALVYSTNGRDIRLRAASLAGTVADAYWFSPRTGLLYDNAGNQVSGAFEQFPTGTGAPIRVFNPPGTAAAGNDWILKVRVR